MQNELKETRPSDSKKGVLVLTLPKQMLQHLWPVEVMKDLKVTTEETKEMVSVYVRTEEERAKAMDRVMEKWSLAKVKKDPQWFVSGLKTVAATNLSQVSYCRTEIEPVVFLKTKDLESIIAIDMVRRKAEAEEFAVKCSEAMERGSEVPEAHGHQGLRCVVYTPTDKVRPMFRKSNGYFEEDHSTLVMMSVPGIVLLCSSVTVAVASREFEVRGADTQMLHDLVKPNIVYDVYVNVQKIDSMVSRLVEEF